jgi:hypothetical protein
MILSTRFEAGMRMLQIRLGVGMEKFYLRTS